MKNVTTDRKQATRKHFCKDCNRQVDRYNVGIITETIARCLRCWAAADYQPRKEAN